MSRSIVYDCFMWRGKWRLSGFSVKEEGCLCVKPGGWRGAILISYRIFLPFSYIIKPII